MKDAHFLRKDARPHTGFCTHEADAKMVWTVLPHPVHSPYLAPFDYHLFGHVKVGLHGYQFADDKELKQSFHYVLQTQGGEFYIGIQHLTQCWLKCFENDGDFMEKLPHNRKIKYESSM
jgi:hypothetical protein